MLTVVWDVDDVLNDLMYQWFTHCWLIERPESCLCYSGLIANPPHQVLGMTREDYLHSLDEFRKTGPALNMEPNGTILAWFQSQGARFRHVALTARPLESAPDVAHWVISHFGAWVRCFGVVPSRMDPHVPIYDRSKADYLQWLRCGDVLIDDSEENILQAESLGMKGILYPQPWNNSTLTIPALLQHLSEMAGES